MATETQLRNAALELIKVMKLTEGEGEDKHPVSLAKNAKISQYEEIIKGAIDFLEEDDDFSIPTKKIINSYNMDWFPEVLDIEEAEIVEEEALPTLEDEIGKAEKLKDLKDIALSEPEFKSIRGRLASFKTVDELRDDMLCLLSDKKTPMKEQPLPLSFDDDPQMVAEKLHDELEAKEINAGKKPVEGAPKPALLGKVLMNAKDLMLIKPFKNLFEIDETILQAIKKNMKKNGYDQAFPITVWEDVVVDGFTRLQAAMELGMKEVPVFKKAFTDEKEALEYAIHNQRDRRNLSDAELLHCIEAIDKPMTKAEAGKKGGKVEEKEAPTHKKTAKELKISETKVTDARVVLSDKKAKKEVESGKKTISKAAKEVREKKKAEKPAKEKPVLAITRIEAAVGVIRINSKKTISIETLIEETEREFISAGGKIGYEKSEVAVNTVLEVLVAFEALEVIGEEVEIF